MDIACRFNKWALSKKIAPSICLIDGFYTNKKIIECVLKQKAFNGFVGRFSKGRNIKTENFNGLLRSYIKTLDIKKDFKQYNINDKEKLIHELIVCLDYGPQFKLVIVIDDPTDIKSARPLITDMLSLSAKTIAEYYALRWKEETYEELAKFPN